MAERIEITDEMTALIGVESEPWPYEVTTSGVRAFARGVGYDDPVYYSESVAREAGYGTLPAPPCYLGTPVYVPGLVDDTFSVPATVSPRPRFGLTDVLDGGTETTYERPLLAGEVLTATHTVTDLTVKQSKALGELLLVTAESKFRDPGGEVVARQRSQVIFY